MLKTTVAVCLQHAGFNSRWEATVHVDEKLVRHSVGDHIRSRRRVLGWRLEEVVARVAEMGVRVSRSTLHRIESGESILPLPTLIGICAALGTSLGFLEEIIGATAIKAPHSSRSIGLEDLLAAANRHGARGDIPRALGCFRAVHDRLGCEKSTADQRERLAKVLVRIGDCYRRLHSYALAWEAAGKALNLEECSAPTRLDALLLHVSIGYMTADYYRARLFARPAADLLDAVPAPIRAFALAVLGNLDFKQDRFDDAVRLLAESRTLYRQLGCETQIARVVVTLGHARHLLGQTRAGIKLIREGHDLARANRHFGTLLYALRTLALIDANRGHWEAAQALFDHAAALARKHDLPHELFLTWHCRWEAARTATMEREERQARTVLGRMLRKVHPGLPEADAFIAAALARSRDRPRATP